MTVQEGDKLIAKFMGITLSKDGGLNIMKGSPYPLHIPTRYHLSLDWLYPVFQKLMTLKFPTSLRLHWARRIGPIRKSFADGEDIKIIYPQIVKALQWYNTNKPINHE